VLEGLIANWEKDCSQQARKVVHYWLRARCMPAELSDLGPNTLGFSIDLSSLRLRGLANPRCLLIGGNDRQLVRKTAARFFHQEAALGHLPIVLAISDAAYSQVATAIPKDQCLILAPFQVEELLAQGEPYGYLRRYIRQNIPLRRLIPFSILHPATGNMFYGRRSALSRLRDQMDQSFAVVGPRRLGKSSLVKQHLLDAKRRGEAHISAQFHIDCYDCHRKDADAVARFLAMKIDEGSRSARMTAADLVNFFRYQKRRIGQRLELILDEVDGICTGTAFLHLGTAAKEGYCRLIMCGRSELFRMALSGDSPVGCRLEMLRLQPLNRDEARQLLAEPLADLGLSFDREEDVTYVARLTGRQPNLLQFFGYHLAEQAMEANRTTIQREHIDQVKWDEEAAQFLLSPIIELEDQDLRALALAILRHGSDSMSIEGIGELASRAGIALDPIGVFRACSELTVHNVLVWERGAYRVANQAMIDYARFLGWIPAEARETSP